MALFHMTDFSKISWTSLVDVPASKSGPDLGIISSGFLTNMIQKLELKHDRFFNPNAVFFLNIILFKYYFV